jgi:CBS domain-containing protein
MMRDFLGSGQSPMGNTYTVSKTKTVKDLIAGRIEVYSVMADEMVIEAALDMRHYHLRAIGVVDVHDKLVGLISHTDLANKVVAQDLDSSVVIKHIMSRNLVSVREDASVTDCLNLMLVGDINHLVVLGENDKFLGLISRKDVDRACLEQLEEYARAMNDYVSQS